MLSNVHDLLYPLKLQDSLINNKSSLNRFSKNIMQHSYDDQKSRNLWAQSPLIRATMKQRTKRKYWILTIYENLTFVDYKLTQISNQPRREVMQSLSKTRNLQLSLPKIVVRRSCNSGEVPVMNQFFKTIG